ncbi:hypothetical protein HanRHA438_Chr15g0701661 [Helianthus annuus]|nr:hypothetical protein HanRHA438_Chr15g0701661 [Helianthus annuus]
MCNLATESADHLLITCEYAQQVWVAVSLWIKIPFPRYLLSEMELLEHLKLASHKQKRRRKRSIWSCQRFAGCRGK